MTYVQKHLAGEAESGARDKFSVYFNLDNGTVPIAGFYLEGNEPMARIMAAWLKPLADLGATIATTKGIGATDHLSFKAVGLPGFQAVQDYRNYDVRTHHTNMDTDERVPPGGTEAGGGRHGVDPVPRSDARRRGFRVEARHDHSPS